MDDLNKKLEELRDKESQEKYSITIALKSGEYSHLRNCAERLEIIDIEIQNTINKMVDRELERQKEQTN